MAGQKRLVHQGLLMLLIVCLGSAMRAQALELLGVEPVDYTGYVIDADGLADGPSLNRHQIRAQSEVRVENPGPNLLLVAYELHYRLLDAAGQPHPILSAEGQPLSGATLVVQEFYGVAPGVTVRQHVAVFRPAEQLDPYEAYAFEVRLVQSGGGRPQVETSGPWTFYHFTNLVSNDPAYNVIATLDQLAFTREYAVNTAAAKNAFQVRADFTLHRYDNFAGSAFPEDNIPLRLGFHLRDFESGEEIPLVAQEMTFTEAVAKHRPWQILPPRPEVVESARVFSLRPAEGVQLDSVDGSYYVVATLAHQDHPGQPGNWTMANARRTAATQLLHFNGTLWFGNVETEFGSIANDPEVGSVSAGSHVGTTLAVDQDSGVVVSHPIYTYGDATPLSVRLLVNGDAVVTAGSVPLNLPAEHPFQEVHCVRVRLTDPSVLTPDGLLAWYQVILPTGAGYRMDTQSRFLRTRVSFGPVLADDALLPQEDPTFAPAGGFYVSEESKPLWFQVSSMTWRVTEGRFEMATLDQGVRHVRAEEYAALAEAALVLDNPQRELKRSNDRYFEFVSGVGAILEWAADSQCAARASFELQFGAGEFRTHFPYDSRLRWQAGQMLVEEDRVVPAQSGLVQAEPVEVRYAKDCLEAAIHCGFDLANALFGQPTLVPEGGALTFTRDGGLVGTGALQAAEHLQWGHIPTLGNEPGAPFFAHQSFLYGDAHFHMPGAFLRGDQVAIDVLARAAVLLYTGVSADNPGYLERPDLAGTQNFSRYHAGLADYAGLNFYVRLDAARQAESVLTGEPTGVYQLKGNSKYYARFAGVSGVHDAVPGSFPSQFALYGYDFNFDDFGFSFLDNGGTAVPDSLIHGRLNVPYPSDFVQEFDQLRFDCLGGIASLEMVGPDQPHPLVYWNGHFVPRAIDFVSDNACDPSEGYLVFGAETQVAHVGQTLFGNLGFLPDGNLIARAAGPAAVDSRLKLPNHISIQGPADEEYELVPVADAYFNHHGAFPVAQAELGPGGFGWINVAGKLAVPFFEELKVHLHTSANAASASALIHMMGGWPTGANSDNYGWQIQQLDYFSAAYFDDQNRGYASSPADLTPQQYRSYHTEQYHVRAQRSWLGGMIQFDYPLNWFTSSRSFRSMAPKTRDFLVLSTENEVKYLSAKHAELTFGTQFDFLPQANLANFAFNAISDELGVSEAIAEAIGIQQRQEIEEAFESMDRLLSSRMDLFFEEIFEKAFEKPINDLFDDLETQFNVFTDPALFLAEADNRIQGKFKDDVLDRLKNLAGNAQDDERLLHVLAGYLEKFQKGLEGVVKVLEKDDDGKRGKAFEMARKLVEKLATEFQDGFIAEVVHPALQESDATFDELVETFERLAEITAGIREHMTNLGNLQTPAGIGVQLDLLLTASTNVLGVIAQQVADATLDYFQGIDYAVDAPFVHHGSGEIKQFIHQEIEDSFFSSPVSADIQMVMRQWFYENNAAVREAMDSVFAEINSLIRWVINQTSEQLGNEFSSLLGDMGSMAAGAKINGYAHINGDSLKELRLDLTAKFKLEKEMSFRAYFRIKELDSEGSPGCQYPGDTATEVTFGAKDVKCEWVSKDLKIAAGAKLTFADDHLLGMGGSFEIAGGMNFQAFNLKFIGAEVAFGALENYISGGVRIGLSGSIIDELAGGIFVGRTCSLSPIKLWDPDAASILSAPPFTGFYGYAEAWVPINQLIGIPSTCLLNLKGGFGMGAGFFAEGPTVLGKIKYGISGSVLCIGIKGELVGLATVDLSEVVGLLNPGEANDILGQGGESLLNNVAIKAIGTVGATIGPCPLCLDVERSVSLTYKNRKWKFNR